MADISLLVAQAYAGLGRKKRARKFAENALDLHQSQQLAAFGVSEHNRVDPINDTTAMGRMLAHVASLASHAFLPKILASGRKAMVVPCLRVAPSFLSLPVATPRA